MQPPLRGQFLKGAFEPAARVALGSGSDSRVHPAREKPDGSRREPALQTRKSSALDTPLSGSPIQLLRCSPASRQAQAGRNWPSGWDKEEKQPPSPTDTLPAANHTWVGASRRPGRWGGPGLPNKLGEGGGHLSGSLQPAPPLPPKPTEAQSCQACSRLLLAIRRLPPSS